MWYAILTPHKLDFGCVRDVCALLLCHALVLCLPFDHLTPSNLPYDSKPGARQNGLVLGITTGVVPLWLTQQDAVCRQSTRLYYSRLAVCKAVTGQVLAEPVLCMCFMSRSVANATGCNVFARADEH